MKALKAFSYNEDSQIRERDHSVTIKDLRTVFEAAGYRVVTTNSHYLSVSNGELNFVFSWE